MKTVQVFDLLIPAGSSTSSNGRNLVFQDTGNYDRIQILKSDGQPPQQPTQIEVTDLSNRDIVSAMNIGFLAPKGGGVRKALMPVDLDNKKEINIKLTTAAPVEVEELYQVAFFLNTDYNG